MLIVKDFKLFIENRTKTLVGHKVTGGLLIVLFYFTIFRLVPTSEEQA